ncbi:hypothetical protein V2G26_020779 [Clonostachys chloroleuca]
MSRMTFGSLPDAPLRNKCNDILQPRNQYLRPLSGETILVSPPGRKHAEYHGKATQIAVSCGWRNDFY